MQEFLKTHNWFVTMVKAANVLSPFDDRGMWGEKALRNAMDEMKGMVRKERKG